jgi:protein involved in temperature-dependent protein secretion
MENTHTAENLGQKTSEALSAAADRAKDAASAVGDYAGETREKVGEWASTAADRMGQAGEAVRDWASDAAGRAGPALRSAGEDVFGWVRRHPITSLFACLGIGLLLARILRER